MSSFQWWRRLVGGRWYLTEYFVGNDLMRTCWTRAPSAGRHELEHFAILDAELYA